MWFECGSTTLADASALWLHGACMCPLRDSQVCVGGRGVSADVSEGGIITRLSRFLFLGCLIWDEIRNNLAVESKVACFISEQGDDISG